MNSSARASVAAMLLPALVILAAYVLFWARPLREEVVRAADAVVEARASAPTPGMRADETQRALRLADRISAARDALAGEALKPASPDPAEGARVTALLLRHRLELLRDGQAGGAAAQLLPASWRSVPGAHERLRTFEVSGRFLDVLAAVTELGAAASAALPLRLDMRQAAAAGDPPIWTLTLWI